jgi:N-acetylneuraminate synthase
MIMYPSIRIGDREIGAGKPVYVIAELSANHHQDFSYAVKLINAAKTAGADAIKIQTYTPDSITIKSNKKLFKISDGTLWKGKNLYNLYREAYMPWEWQPKLKTIANSLGLDLFSTPFDPTSVDFLEIIDPPAYKIASFEIIDLPLIQKIARTGKPIILSTGMASLSEIDEAVQAIRKEGNDQIALLKCTSAYPALPDEMNLKTIPHMAESFNVPVGLSDHTLGIAASVAAVALGACIIEKHFTLSRSIAGPDSAFSAEPEEFRLMAEAVNQVPKMLGRVQYESSENENASKIFRRSLFVVKNMKKGDVFTTDTVRSIRPGNGMPPKYLEIILGRNASKNIQRGTPLTWDLME